MKMKCVHTRPDRTADRVGGPKVVRPVRTYAVTVEGFPPHLYSARSPSKARAQSYEAYLSYDDRITFRQFLAISRVRRAPDPPGIGRRILICGKRPATSVLGRSPNRRYFMYDDSDAILTAHESEITPLIEEAEGVDEVAGQVLAVSGEPAP